MNFAINPLWVSRFIIVASLAIVIKLAMFVPLYFLPHHGVNSVPNADESFYYKYRVAKEMGLKKPKVKKVKKAQANNLNAKGPEKKMVFSGTLKAIYSTKINPFIVVEVKKKVQLVSIKDKLEGYTLIEIYPEYAVFVKSSTRYALRFKEDKKSKNMRITEAAPEELPDVDAAVFVKRKEINYYAKNLKQIWKNIKIKEVIKDKRLQGFRVTWIKKGSIFDKLGLRKDDLITGVNNKKFKSISQVFKLYNNMKKMDNLKLTIMRGNEEKELEYEIL